jgi:hypothetical protein
VHLLKCTSHSSLPDETQSEALLLKERLLIKTQRAAKPRMGSTKGSAACLEFCSTNT